MPSLSEDDDDKSDSEGEELDKQMGDLNGEEADKLDERLWGDDDEEEDEEDHRTEETGPGMDEVLRVSLSPHSQAETCHLLLFLPFFFFSFFPPFLFLFNLADCIER